MLLKKLGAAMLAAIAIGATIASASQAAMWEVETTPLASNEAVDVELVGTATLTAKILGQTLKWTATGVKDVNGELVKNSANATGKLKLTGVTVDEPAGCKSAEIETVALKATAAMGNTEATAADVYVKVSPVSGETFATVKLTECPAAGSYPLKGTFYLEALNGTGVLDIRQQLDSSAAINASQGGSLMFGKEAAALEATLTVRLAGANAAKEWRVTG